MCCYTFAMSTIGSKVGDANSLIAALLTYLNNLLCDELL